MSLAQINIKDVTFILVGMMTEPRSCELGSNGEAFST
jgi:hypothetical protein